MDNWGLSSSSESESDEDRPVSSLRTNSAYYHQFQNGESGANWPHNVLESMTVHRNSNGYTANSSMIDGNASLTNGHASFADISQIPTLDNSRIISQMVDDYVLINEGGTFRPVRVIQKETLGAPHKTPVKKVLSSTNPDLSAEAAIEDVHVPEIPLEIIDFIDIPKDPRTQRRDDFGDEDAAYEGLVVPSFWRETILKSAQQKNFERNVHLNGSFKQSMSFVREKQIQRIQRQSMVQRRDPRLQRYNESLFETAPRKISSPPKALNKSEPNITPADVFGDTGNVSSDDEKFSSQSSATPSVIDEPSNITVTSNHNKMSESLSESEDEEVFRFSEFAQKRIKAAINTQASKRTKYDETSSDKKVPPIRIKLPKKRVTPAKNKNKNKKENLFGTPPRVSKNDILNALTDDTSDEPEDISSNISKKSVGSDAKPKKMIVTPIPNLKIPPKITNASKKNATAKSKPVLEENIEISDGSNDAMNAQPAEHFQTNHNRSSSEASQTSIGSIEKRMAEMISPVKTAAEVRAEQQKFVDEQLAGMLPDYIPQPNKEPTEQEVHEQPQIVQNRTDAIERVMVSTEYATNETDIELQPLVDSNFNFTDIIPNKLNNHVNGQVQENCQDKLEESPVNIPIVADIVQASNGNEQAQSDGDLMQDQNSEELRTLSANLSFSDDIAANAEIFESTANIIQNLDEYSKVLGSLSDMSDIGNVFETGSKDGAKSIKKRAQRTKIIIHDFSMNGIVPTTLKPAIDEDVSEDDFEDELPCGMDELILPNSNTDRNAIDKLKTNCGLCSYSAKSGWKQLTKHYVRMHPGKEISIARLSKEFNPQDLMQTSIAPIVTKGTDGTLIQSLCYICNDVYKMCGDKWLMHFIAHTGEFEFRCNKCGKEIAQDLHKKCNSSNNVRINGPHQFIENVLYGYVCSTAECSYIQLSKKNVEAHLENEHQQLITGHDNIIEITLLKIAQPPDFFEDTKTNSSLVEAKLRVSDAYPPNRYEKFEPVEITDDESDVEVCAESKNDGFVDLTLSDDDD